ncbi:MULTISPECIES: heme biosynthesis protein HemY [unclassified Mesorhizobium]|uniref:heme biosynthesis protein HemY n=1 Tax=unclassified Mesorhizobium TaxID=325217 RepID=UPI00112E7B0D|nr:MULTISPECIES: heme biosynthesis protein HemY [unclassified Mesorhizobium]MBZ9919185.1 heme biosynthesis protein HemY [Mesorhizobium sp. BR1-1-7]MBZ9952581.1 heme biosynthesis protein HemY [Mesorhizobium sp. BR1-1-15]MBZ9968405.1 heme biosynthesis protein HemY [Mesorhizobium sp. BR1-1-12]MCA0024171.1 heme biosynthesis protein HemY [Mesorhizobium sp. B263B1A]TPK01097.1 heme biosynthesis protein HemY [Mesorhizobium sp. B2-5-12]
MIRILLFLAVVFALGLGFAWLADRPGDMVITFNGYQYQVSLMVAAVAVVAVVAAVMILWWLIKSVWNSPYTISRYFRVRRRDRGYQALSTGMIAAGAGDGALARKKTKEAAKLIRSDQEPLIHLLEAQASLLEGDHEGARQKFESMLDDPEMRLLGLRGLYLEAERLGDRNAARHYAGRAAGMAPQLAWAAESTLEELTGRGDWDGALKLVEAQKATRQIERDAANRRRAVLLTAKAQSLADSDPAAARTAAIEANRLQPEFAPAAVAAATLLFRQNDVRKGSKILETAWRAEPHPEIAELYTHARPGDAVLDRLNRAKKLQEMRKNHAESSMTVARAALDAQDFATARREAEAAIRMDRREGAYLLLADIEEAETGDQGKVRQLLSKAVRAPRDPAWVADGVVSERWAPVSPVTGRLDAFEWRAPMERLGQLIDSRDDAPDAPAVAIEAPGRPAQEESVEVIDHAGPGGETAGKQAENDQDHVRPVTAQAFAAVPADAEAVEPAQELARLPDDPGVDPDDAAEKSPRRFRLF